MARSDFELAKARLNPGPEIWRRCEQCLRKLEAGEERCREHLKKRVQYVRELTEAEKTYIPHTDETVICVGQE